MKKKNVGLGFIPKIVGFWVWVLDFIPKSQTQIFLGSECMIGKLQKIVFMSTFSNFMRAKSQFFSTFFQFLNRLW